MSKKLNSKLLSIILAIAICCATLCGSLIAAHAAAADFNGTYTISVGDDKQAVPFAATEVKAQVKFDLPAGFVGGEFTAKAQSDYTIGDKATVVAGTKKDGTALTAAELANVEIVTKANGSNKDIRFVIGDGVLCTSITIEYTLVFNKDKYVNNGNTSQYLVGIDVDGANFGVNGDYADVEFAASADSDTFFHSHSSWYATAGLVLDAEKNGKHTVTLNNARCHLCTHGSGLGLPVNDNYIAQVLPDYTEFEGATTPLIPEGDTDGGSTTAWIGISGVTVSYNANGELDVDVHVYSQWRSGNGDKIVLIICDKEGNELYRLAPVPNGSSYFAGVGFPAEEKKFTISGLSAKNLDTELLLTAVEYSSGSLEISRTMSFCLADWCEKVVTGNGAVWADGATDEQIEADKDVAAALYYYGASIQDNVFDKNTAGGGSTSGIEYVNANYDEWDGTTSQPTKTDSEGNIVISTAEELAWIALEGAANTANKNYKVVDNSVFNMKGMDGITMNSTAAQVEAAGKARIAASQWSADHNWRLVSDSAGNAFLGNFDGNGLVVYNIFSRVYAHAGLFPCTDPSAQGTQTIKNVAVYASFMSAYHYSGGIVGLADAPHGTGYTMKFDSCATKNSYIDDMSSTHERTTGTIVGGLGHNTTVINNCLALNNKLVSTGIIGGFFGNTSNYGGDPTVSNSLSIGSTIAPTSVGVALGSKVPNTTYTNVYDEDVDAATLGSAWFNTETYPELSIFHKLSKQYVDENTHKVICVLKAGGNACTLKGVTEEHTLVKNAEGNAKVCECGYSVPVYKDIEYITANYDEWDGTRVQPTETDSEGNIIIRNAEQLAWIALEGSTATNDINYKVVANSVFNMKGMDGITLNSTVADVKAASKKWQMRWVPYVDGTATDTSNVTFGGNFDGNGLTVYNISGGAGGGVCYQGLFPVIKQSANGITQEIKNVKIVASYFVAYHCAGALIGGSPMTPGTDNVLNIDNVAVENCYITDNGNTNAACSRTAGVIAGNVGHNKTTVNNCFALNNELVATNIYGGLIANTSQWSSGVAINNSVIIGTPKAPVDILADDKAINTPVTNAKYTNVYTEDVAAATLGSAWFDTTTYPELSIFHKMTTEYVNDSTHKSVCTIVANGINCTVCGTAEEHTFTQNVDKMECTCGYYEFVIGNRLTPTELNYDEWDGTFTQPTAQDTSGNIIITTAEELAWIALRGATATNGVNYKVADNTVFNMMGMSGINMNSTVDEVKAAPKNNDRKWQTQSDTVAKTVAFAGNFDGNGVIVYNIYTGTGRCAGGLFPAIYPSDNTAATIKNVAVMASHFGGYHYTGAIIGQANAGSSSTKLVLEGAVVKNCYIYDNNDQNSACQRTTGTLVGHLLHTESTINNCLVVGNEVSAQGIKGGLFGNTSIYGGANKVSNTVSIGTAIESVSVNYAKNNKQVTYTNVHSSNVSAAQLGDAWFDTTTYPELKIFHDMQAIYEDENTHKTACGYVVDGVQCKVCGTASNHELVINAAGTEKVCACGIKEKVVGNVVVPNHVNYDEWDGTRVQPTKTDSEGNIVISTAEELAWIALEGSTATNDINYKAVANSVFNMKGMDGITLNSTADDIKAASKKWQMRWVPYVDGTATDTGNVTFGGNFDGNGLTVYNISGGAGGGVCYQGLFPVLKQSANGVTQEIKNVQIVASYFVGYHNAGALIGSVPAAPGTDCKLNIENISVKNCYITDNANTNAACSRTVGVIAGNVGHNKTTVNNCFAINNELVATNIYGGLIANTSQWSSGVVINNSVIIGTPKAPIDILDDGKNIETPAANTTYTNVHTDDVDAATLGSAWFDTTTYPELKIFHDLKTIYIDENTHQTVCQHFVNGVQCSVSQAICGHTMVGNADNTYTECECGFGYEIKGIHAMNLPACILERITNNTIYNERFATNALFKAAYSADVFGTDVQENVFDLYATSLNLKVNPHIAFTFAFHGDYKTNKANITATFSVEGQVIATVTGDQMINNSGAGRYHLYRLKSLGVTKLSKPVTVTVTYGGSTYDFGTYSAAGYAINAMNAGADYQEHVNASMALVYYSEMLAARQGK